MLCEMQKDFDQWNSLKKKIEEKAQDRNLFFYEREVWWGSLGLNIGVESDGKNLGFERPILIIKKFNGEMVWGVPLTSKEKDVQHYYKIEHDKGISWVCLSQMKIISTKRLLRKIGVISETEFNQVLDKLCDYLKRVKTNRTPLDAGPSEAEATNR